MIHGLKLPDITRERLMDIVQMQIDLLYYAASYDDVKKETCISHFREKPLEERFKGRGETIADWLWDTRTTIRHEYLKRFATIEREERQNKLSWCLRQRKEVCGFSRLHTDTMETSLVIDDFFDGEPPISYKKPDSITTWRNAAASFFLYFYGEFLGTVTATPFPGRLFPGDVQKGFGRKELLDAFFDEKANQGLEVCPACGVSNFYVRGQNKIHTSLDHYLPKSRYPHFSCHPYNLIPVCHFCNSSIKGEKDPLMDAQQQRQSQYRSALPYGAIDLSSYAYLDIQVKEPGKPVTVKVLRPRPDKPELANNELQKAIEMVARLYDIPGSWERASGTISETLFRRIRQFLGNSSIVATALPIGFDVPNEVNNLLEQLLFYLSDKDEDLRKDAYAFAMTWILVALINEHVQPAIEAQRDRRSTADCGVPNYDPSLLEEFVSWFGQDLEENDNRAREARKLLQIPRRGS